jgi:hypothetical protein
VRNIGKHHMFPKLVGNIFASREANFVSATMFPRVGKHGNIRGNIENLVNVTATMFSSLPRALDSNQEQLRRIQPCISPAHTSMSCMNSTPPLLNAITKKSLKDLIVLDLVQLEW